MDLYHVIIRPLITEKTTHQSKTTSGQHGATYSFEVHPEASKTEIKDAIEKVYRVNVVNVRTSNRKGKLRRFRFRVGRTRHTKKAIITVDRNSHIDLF